MGIRLLAGRAFTTADQLTEPGQRRRQPVGGEPAVAGEGSPIGRRLQREGIDAWETVVGVVDDVMQDNFRDTPPALVYFPLVGPAAGGAGWSRRRRTS